MKGNSGLNGVKQAAVQRAAPERPWVEPGGLASNSCGLGGRGPRLGWGEGEAELGSPEDRRCHRPWGLESGAQGGARPGVNIPAPRARGRRLSLSRGVDQQGPPGPAQAPGHSAEGWAGHQHLQSSLLHPSLHPSPTSRAQGAGGPMGTGAGTPVRPDKGHGAADPVSALIFPKLKSAARRLRSRPPRFSAV